MDAGTAEFLRRFYPGGVDAVAALSDREAFKRTFGDLVEPDFETVAAPGQLPLSGSSADESRRFGARGLDGFLETFHDWLTAWDSWVIAKPEFIELEDDRILALFDVVAHSKTHGVEMPVEGANLLTIRGGKLARIELFLDQDAGRRAAGLD